MMRSSQFTRITSDPKDCFWKSENCRLSDVQSSSALSGTLLLHHWRSVFVDGN